MYIIVRRVYYTETAQYLIVCDRQISVGTRLNVSFETIYDHINYTKLMDIVGIIRKHENGILKHEI